MPNLSRAEIFGITVFIILALTWFGRVTLDIVHSKELKTNETIASQDTPEKQTIMVHIAGGVENPKVYELPIGSRIEDAIKTAGGAVMNADLLRLNLAQTLSDGDKIFVPIKGESSQINLITKSDVLKKPSSKKSTPKPRFPLNINTATIEELMTLPGIGEVRARDVIEYRDSHGGFKKIEEIINVKGIGEVTFEKIKGLIYI